VLRIGRTTFYKLIENGDIHIVRNPDTDRDGYECSATNRIAVLRGE